MTTLERHPDDLPPAPPELARGPRRLPRGFGWALVLAGVVSVVAVWVLSGAESDDPDSVTLPGTPTTVVDAAGTAAPSTTFETFDGASSSLAAYRGRPLVVNFWASSCVPCLTEMPAFEEVHAEVGGDIAFLGLNVADSAERGRQMADRTGVTYDLARDPQGLVARELGSTTLPTTAIIDADGRVVDVHVGALDANELRAAIEGLR